MIKIERFEGDVDDKVDLEIRGEQNEAHLVWFHPFEVLDYNNAVSQAQPAPPALLLKFLMHVVRHLHAPDEPVSQFTLRDASTVRYRSANPKPQSPLYFELNMWNFARALGKRTFYERTGLSYEQPLAADLHVMDK